MSLDNSIAYNYGEISSLQYYGVYYDGIASDTMTLHNYGTITGGAGAFMGNEEVDIVINGGLMVGDVLLGDGNDVFTFKAGGSVIGDIKGGGGNDTMTGNADGNIFFGDAGRDDLLGRGGDDTLNGGGGNDTLKGGWGDDELNGGGGKDQLSGGKGDDALNGGGGNDTLNGNRGNDELTGNGGADEFVFGRHSGNDTVTDFEDGVDKIDLSAFNLANRAELNAAGAMTDTNLGMVIDLSLVGGDGQILIEGMLVADLNNSDIIF